MEKSKINMLDPNSQRSPDLEESKGKKLNAIKEAGTTANSMNRFKSRESNIQITKSLQNIAHTLLNITSSLIQSLFLFCSSLSILTSLTLTG